jgi:hypothetical protein
MADMMGPETLRALATGLRVPAALAEIDALLAHADAWGAERVNRIALAEQLDFERLTNGRLTEQLAAAQKRVEVLDQDRRWWQENAIKRRKRAATRRSEHPPRGRERT